MLGIIRKCLFKIIYILVIIYLLIFIPTIWGQKPLVVISGSMEPTLKVGGILYYHDKNYEEFNKGDILIYKLDDHIISHRIYDIIENGIITKGDANSTYDNLLVNENQILGIGTNWSIPLIGYYADFVYRHKFLLVFSFIVVLVDILCEKSRIRKEGNECEKEV